MSSDKSDLGQTIARHELEIRRLQDEVRELRDGQAKEKLQAEIAHRISELEADIKLQELQEAMAREGGQKQRRNRFLGIF